MQSFIGLDEAKDPEFFKYPPPFGFKYSGMIKIPILQFLSFCFLQIDARAIVIV